MALLSRALGREGIMERVVRASGPVDGDGPLEVADRVRAVFADLF